MSADNSKILTFLKGQRKAFKTLSAALSKKRPDMDDLHALRVTTRKIKSIIWLLKSSDIAKKSKLNKNLKELAHILGQVRELDVGITDSKKFGLHGARLENQKHKALKNLNTHLQSKKFRKIQHELKDFQKEIEKSDQLEISGAVTIMKSKLHGNGRKQPSSKPALHRMRRDFKRARYILEIFDRPVSPLKTVQDKLGRIHDLELLEKMCGRHKMVTKEILKRQKAADRLVLRGSRFAIEQLSRL
jgi:CHAD domain-containing protein